MQSCVMLLQSGLQQADSPTTTSPGLFIITLLIRPNRWRLQWRQGHLWNSSLCSHKQCQTIYFNLCLVRVQTFLRWRVALVVEYGAQLIGIKVDFVHCHYDGRGILCRRHTAAWSSDTSRPLCCPTVRDPPLTSATCWFPTPRLPRYPTVCTYRCLLITTVAEFNKTELCTTGHAFHVSHVFVSLNTVHFLSNICTT